MNLPSVRAGLRWHQIDNELMIYDEHENLIHLLNPCSAEVLRMLQKGMSSAQITEVLGADHGAQRAAALLEVALDELTRVKLVTAEGDEFRKGAPTRREALQRLIGAGATMLIPAIISLSPRTAEAQGTQQANGTVCIHSFQCASKCCGTNNGGGCSSGKCSPAGVTGCGGACAP